MAAPEDSALVTTRVPSVAVPEVCIAPDPAFNEATVVAPEDRAPEIVAVAAVTPLVAATEAPETAPLAVTVVPDTPPVLVRLDTVAAPAPNVPDTDTDPADNALVHVMLFAVTKPLDVTAARVEAPETDNDPALV